MPEVIQGIRGIISGFVKANRNTFFNLSSSAPSPSTVCLLTTTTNSISKTNTVLPGYGKVDSHGKISKTNTVLTDYGKVDSHGKKQVVMVGHQS